MADQVSALAQTLQSKEPDVPVWVMVVLFFTFPPAAFFLMRQQKKYYRYLPFALMALGALIFLVFGVILVFGLPELNRFFANYSVTPTNYLGPISALALVYGLVQFVLGFWGQIEMNKENILPRVFLNLSILLLVLDYCLVFLLPVLIVLSIIVPIYSSVANLK